MYNTSFQSNNSIRNKVHKHKDWKEKIGTLVPDKATVEVVQQEDMLCQNIVLLDNTLHED